MIDAVTKIKSFGIEASLDELSGTLKIKYPGYACNFEPGKIYLKPTPEIEGNAMFNLSGSMVWLDENEWKSYVQKQMNTYNLFDTPAPGSKIMYLLRKSDNKYIGYYTKQNELIISLTQVNTFIRLLSLKTGIDLKSDEYDGMLSKAVLL